LAHWLPERDDCHSTSYAPAESNYDQRSDPETTFMKAQEYDLIAIGGGTAGLVSAAGGAYLGVRSGLVEKAALGGDCLWTGCVPSKAVIASSRLAHAMRNAEDLGLTSAAPKHAFADVMARMRAARGVVEHHDDPERFRDMGVDVHFGAARFLSPHEVDVEGVGRMRSKRFVIATGAIPVAPSIPGLAEAGYLDHHRLFEIDSLPDQIAVLGAGPIGLEMAQMLSRLGASVTVVEMANRILPKEDRDVADALLTILRSEGIDVRLNTKVTQVTVEDGKKVLLTASGERISADQLLVATGRRPATEGLDLEKAGVRTERGAVVVDRGLRTSSRTVWAAGDVTGGLQFTHVAEYMAKTVLRNSLLPGTTKVDYGTVPWVTYTDPEIAHVGLLQAEAEQIGGTTYRYGLDDLDRAIVDGTARGFVKISADRKGRILGATIMGSHAGDLLMPLVLAKKNGLKLSDISTTIFPYPTMVEGLKRTSDAYQRARLEGTSGTILRKVISWLK
jgi:pyruvate/2-oxoglutarate dehydrogenase complex dihydrolipoamide dehydrogenase (E3) component